MKERIINAAVAITPFVVLAAVWEAVAIAGVFPPKLFPPLGSIASTFFKLIANGILWTNIEGTLVRLAWGFLLAAVVGVGLGVLMGRFRIVEDIFLPPVSFAYPIPGLAYAPLFMLWFGLGNLPAILLVGAASCFVVILNTWKGVKTVKPIWLKAAEAMGAGEAQMFWRVIVPGALPYVLTGLRLGLAQAWRILIAVEMLVAVDRGLGWLIFGAQQFLATDVMLSGIIAIGVIGVLLEKQVFARLERYTVVRWGMLTA